MWGWPSYQTTRRNIARKFVLSVTSSVFRIKFATPSDIIPEHNYINRNEKLQTAGHKDVDIILWLHVSAFVESRLQEM